MWKWAVVIATALLMLGVPATGDENEGEKGAKKNKNGPGFWPTGPRVPRVPRIILFDRLPKQPA